MSFLTSRGIAHIGLLGLSTGAEAVVTEAASDKRVDAVVADGLQARTAADASQLPFGDRISVEPSFAVAGIEIRLVRGERQPRPLIDVVQEVARTRPLLLIATIAFEREIDRVYTSGTKAQLWGLPASAHTKGLTDHPISYAHRVLSVFDKALMTARSTQPPKTRALQAAVVAFAAAHPMYPGVALRVISPRLRWVGAAGHDALGSTQALQPGAGFRIASVTKTFTAAAILRLVESGRLGLDDPIVDRLSAATASILRRGGYDIDAIRIRHLLMHTSGLYDYASDPAFVSYVLAHGRHHWTRREQVRFAMPHRKPYAATGPRIPLRRHRYSCSGRSSSGGPGARSPPPTAACSLRQAGIAANVPRDARAATRRGAAACNQYYQRIDATAFDPSFDLYGGGGLVSTVDDLASFYRALFHGRCSRRARPCGRCSANRTRDEPPSSAWASSPTRSAAPAARTAGHIPASGAPLLWTAHARM